MAVSRVTYCSREAVKSRLDIKLTARADAIVDEAIEAAADDIDELCHRVFYPTAATRYFDWPASRYGTSWRLWLDQHELISVATLTAGGTTVAASDYLLRPDDGPPYTRVEINTGTSAVFASGDTPQRAIAITGVFGHSANRAAAGALTEALDASETGVDVTNGAAAGVGDLVMVDSERMLVTDKLMVNTGQNVSALAADWAAVSVTVADGTTFTAGETITVDSERMRVDQVTGNTLTVARAWDGAALAAHSAGADIWAPRTLAVERGAYGTTAATHASAAAAYRHVPPALVRKLSRALAEDTVLQEASGYARVVGSGDNERQASRADVNALREQLYWAFGRKGRMRHI